MKASAQIKADVIVVGGGPAGIAAAVSSSRLGARTILVEKCGYLGGMATAGLVNPFMVPKYNGKPLVGGIFSEIIRGLRPFGAAVDGELFGQYHIAFDPDELEQLLSGLMKKNKISLLLGHSVIGTVEHGGCVRGIVSRKGAVKREVLAKLIIDATGNGDVAFYSGAAYSKGRDNDHLMQPATLNFNVGGVNAARMPSRGKMDRMFLEAKARKEIKVPREKLLWFETTRPSELHFNVTRIPCVDGTKKKDIAFAEKDGRRQVKEVFAFLKGKVPGFEKAFISRIADQVGFRETRRVKGRYMLTKKDMIAGKIFADTIALNNYPIDIHDPEGKGTEWKKINKPYGIPFRSLIPIKVKGLIVAGRCISVTHEALSSIRIMPVCMATGQAAGVAAGLCVKKGIDPKEIDVEDVRQALLEQGAVLEC